MKRDVRRWVSRGECGTKVDVFGRRVWKERSLFMCGGSEQRATSNEQRATSSEQRAGKRGRHASLAPPGTNQQYHYHQHQPVPTLGQRPSPAPAPAPTLINRNRPICNTREDCRWPPLRARPCLPSPDDPIPSQQREAKPYNPASQIIVIVLFWILPSSPVCLPECRLSRVISRATRDDYSKRQQVHKLRSLACLELSWPSSLSRKGCT
jgi:hypothetical protein